MAPKQKPKNKIEIVFFDLGGTLIFCEGAQPDLEMQSVMELVNSIRKSGYLINEKQFMCEFLERLKRYHQEREYDQIEHTTAQLLRELLENQWNLTLKEVEIRTALEKMYAVTQAHYKLEEEAVETLEKLVERGYKLGVISNAADNKDVETLIDQQGLRKYFNLILTSAAIGIRKPSPEIFLKGLGHWKASASQAVMVGDSLQADILGAKMVGMKGIWFTHRAAVLPVDLKGKDVCVPDQVIHRLGELPGALDALG